MDEYARAELLAVIRQVRKRWRTKLAIRGAVGFLVAGLLAIFALAAALDYFRFSPAAIFWFRLVAGVLLLARRAGSSRVRCSARSPTNRSRSTSKNTSPRSTPPSSPRWPSPATGPPLRCWCAG